MTGSEKAGVGLIDIKGHNKGRDNRVNREETVTLANKAKDLESGSGKLCTTTLVQRKNIRNNPGLTDQTAPNLLDPGNHSSRRRSENLIPYKRPHS